MSQAFRVIDSGVIEGRLNIAIGQAIIEAHQAGTFDTREREKFGPEDAAPETKLPREE